MPYNPKVMQLADEILNIIDHADDMTRSDLQGVLHAFAMRILTDNDHGTAVSSKKLYATVSSERASQGQGGNEFIDIDICDELQQPLARLVFMQHHDETSDCDYLLVEDPNYRHSSLEINVNAKKP
jgi:hypothetical protein